LQLYNWTQNHDPVPPKDTPAAIDCIKEDNSMGDGSINGWIQAFRFTDTDIIKETFEYHGRDVQIDSVPKLFWTIRDRIGETLEIPVDHSFLSVSVMYKESYMRPHYDPAVPGYVTLKGNVCVKAPEGNGVTISKKFYDIEERSLSAIEVSLFPHEVKPVAGERVNFCYGFAVPCEVLGWDIDSPRMRRSKKQWDAIKAQEAVSLGG